MLGTTLHGWCPASFDVDGWAGQLVSPAMLNEPSRLIA